MKNADEGNFPRPRLRQRVNLLRPMRLRQRVNLLRPMRPRANSSVRLLPV
jgi:hypothetical protein